MRNFRLDKSQALQISEEYHKIGFIIWSNNFILNGGFILPVQIYLFKEKSAFIPLVDKLSEALDQMPETLNTKS